MSIFPTAHFKWKEPKAFLRARAAQERAALRWWLRPLMVLLVALLMMGSWYIARFNPHKHPLGLWVAILMNVGLGWLFAYVVPWMVALCPSEIRLSDNQLLRSRGNTHRSIKYTVMECFGWQTVAGTNVLVIKQRQAKRDFQVALSPETSKDAVNLFLLSRGVMLQPGEKW